MYWSRYWHQHLTMDQGWELLVLSFRVWPSPGSSEDELPTPISHINQQVDLFRNISGEANSMNKSEIEDGAVDTEPQSQDVASPINESEAKSRTAEIAAAQQQILNQITFEFL